MTMFKTSSATTAEEYIAMIADDSRRDEIETLHKFIRKNAPKLKPHIQSGMIAYGTFHYKYPSGREGDWFQVGLASNKNYISVYVMAMDGSQYIAERLKDQLGNVSVGKSCIRFKKISDVHLPGLKEAIACAAKSGGTFAV